MSPGGAIAHGCSQGQGQGRAAGGQPEAAACAPRCGGSVRISEGLPVAAGGVGAGTASGTRDTGRGQREPPLTVTPPGLRGSGAKRPGSPGDSHVRARESRHPECPSQGPLPDPAQLGAGAVATGHERAGGEAVTLCATCSPRASCWVARDVLLAGPERALCGGWPLWHRRRRLGSAAVGPPAAAACPAGLAGSRGKCPQAEQGALCPFLWWWGHLASSLEPLSQADPGGPAPREGSSDPSSPQAGGQSRPLSGPVAPSVPVIGRATRRVLLTPRQRGQARGCGGAGPFHLSAPN